MRDWLKTMRRRWFPTVAERYENGWAFAEAHFANYANEAEFEFLYEGLPFNDRKDPFDRAVHDYARSVNWGSS